jgi:hypothetical protein
VTTKRDDDKDYRAAHAAAVDLANQRQRDVGICRVAIPSARLGYWTVFALPRADLRRGHELTCEVVTPGTPK